MNPAIPLISLITDFGLEDEYAGALKGVILNHSINIHTVDISHAVPPQDIKAAARLLDRSYRYFPPGTVHLVIVDPGVGSNRQILAIAADSYYFVGPDNGVFTPILEAAESLSVYRVTNPDLFTASVSDTFHGRDVMAPVAAKLATGLAIDRVGPPIDHRQCVIVGPPACELVDGVLQGQIVNIDKFGNLCTNISREDVDKFGSGKEISIRVGNITIDTLCSCYSGQPKGALLALYDSNGCLEIAENSGNASKRLGVSPEETVSLELK